MESSDAGEAAAEETSPAQASPASAAADAAGTGEAGAAPQLTAQEQEILAFERRWWRHAGAKEQAIRDTFDLSATRYYQILNGLLDDPAALAHDPVVVGRLRRLRASRARAARAT